MVFCRLALEACTVWAYFMNFFFLFLLFFFCLHFLLFLIL